MTVTHEALRSGDPGAWPEFLTVPEVAKILRVSKMTVYRMVHHGELDSIRVGRSFRVKSAGLDAYIASGQVPGEQERHSRD